MIVLVGLLDPDKDGFSRATLGCRLREMKQQAEPTAVGSSGSRLTAPASSEAVPASPCDKRCLLFPQDEVALTDWIIMMDRFGDLSTTVKT
mmetsp:Transcript_3723/g.9352  ORF Transcript_3723/g.9352 Transcript_3723/m.9352 type:complete len:91 (+) Transcript_3723:440-712(+)